jgi:hypothetical protein
MFKVIQKMVAGGEELSDRYNLSDMDKENLYGDDWSKSSQYKLVEWRSEALQLARRHAAAAGKAKFMKYMINIPVLLLAGAVTVLLSLREQWGGAGLTTAAIVVSGVTAFLTALNTFLAPGDKFMGHVQASNAYQNVARNIDYMITLPPCKRPDVEVAYVQATSELNNIATAAPPLKFAKSKNPDFSDIL